MYIAMQFHPLHCYAILPNVIYIAMQLDQIYIAMQCYQMYIAMEWTENYRLRCSAHLHIALGVCVGNKGGERSGHDSQIEKEKMREGLDKSHFLLQIWFLHVIDTVVGQSENLLA